MSEVVVVEDDNIPVAVWEGIFPLCGVNLRCYVLDNGKRIINADDLAAMFQAMGDGALLDPNDVTAFSKWRIGKDS